jgi:hypothetical protein
MFPEGRHWAGEPLSSARPLPIAEAVGGSQTRTLQGHGPRHLARPHQPAVSVTTAGALGAMKFTRNLPLTSLVASSAPYAAPAIRPRPMRCVQDHGPGPASTGSRTDSIRLGRHQTRRLAVDEFLTVAEIAELLKVDVQAVRTGLIAASWLR